ncbi:hypothetical protein C4D60_Mb08t18340 [Musa balbisiana]|uniref:Glycosyltransferase N-terminal domain-containing protein n=1 Tax=Musa balbisiana TaxID=52838 RepID=A0A4S8K4N4_MUSBA|nr:hypothetical protein C4D60_Mb08t18340 [Musa balbisiana]
MRCMSTRKPHVVCIPYPAQGHVTPMMMLAKLLHSHGFHITFVNTQYNHRRLLRSKALSSDDVLPDFRFESIPDGLPPSDKDATQDIPSLCESIQNNALPPFLDLLRQLNEGSPPVSCVVSDGVMSFTLDAAKELSIPEVMFWTPSACGFMGYLHYKHLLERGLTPLKDESDITNGYLDVAVEWIPGLKNMRLKDLPTFIRTTTPTTSCSTTATVEAQRASMAKAPVREAMAAMLPPIYTIGPPHFAFSPSFRTVPLTSFPRSTDGPDDIMLNYCNREAQRASMAKAVIMNTFDELEQPVLEAMAAMLPPIYTIGPLTLLSRRASDSPLTSFRSRSNLWKEESGCLEWLHGRAPASVVYVNFGSITVMTNTQLIEFAWGLANCKYEFLWVIRPDLVKGDAAVLPEEFLEETKGRGLLASWCPQEAVPPSAASSPTAGGTRRSRA